MKHALRIGSFMGVPLRVHWSFSFLILFVVLVTPDHTGPLVMAFVWIVAIFFCVVVHEVAHCVVARRHGLVVRDIVLLPIGGVSEIVGLDQAEKSELAIALAGPLTSLSIAALLALVALGLHDAISPPTLSTGPLVCRVLWANVVIGAFNLLPAFPLDGGRVLRAALARSRPHDEATRIAARVAVFFGYAMALVGFFINLFLIVIGIFVVLAAKSEVFVQEVRAQLGGLRVGDLAIEHPMIFDADRPLLEVADELHRRPSASYPVVRGERYIGMVAVADLGKRPGSSPTGEAAEPVPMLAPSDELWPEATSAFTKSHRHDLAVGVDGRVCAILHDEDLFALLRRKGLERLAPRSQARGDNSGGWRDRHSRERSSAG